MCWHLSGMWSAVMHACMLQLQAYTIITRTVLNAQYSLSKVSSLFALQLHQHSFLSTDSSTPYVKQSPLPRSISPTKHGFSWQNQHTPITPILKISPAAISPSFYFQLHPPLDQGNVGHVNKKIPTSNTHLWISETILPSRHLKIKCWAKVWGH